MTECWHMPICNDTGKAGSVEVTSLIIFREESDFTISIFSNFMAACSSPSSSPHILTAPIFPLDMLMSLSQPAFELSSSHTVVMCITEVLILLPLKRRHVAPIRWTI